MKRHRDAIAVQGGACNPLTISKAIHNACLECGPVGTDLITSDPAVRLMVHQLAFICGIPTRESAQEWSAWFSACQAAELA